MERQQLIEYLGNLVVKYMVLYTTVLFASGCQNQNSNNEAFQINGDTTIKSLNYILNDTVILEKTYYLSKNIIQIDVYDSAGLLKKSVSYQKNGNLKEIINYKNGIQHGAHFIFDSLNKINYYDFYYFGNRVGPVVYYEHTDDPKDYSFLNFENRELIHIDYSKWKGIDSFIGSLLNYNITSFEQNGKKYHNLFIYLPVIPKMDLIYELYELDKLNNKSKLICELKSIDPFMNMTLDQIAQNHTFEIRVTAINRLTSDTTIIRDF